MILDKLKQLVSRAYAAKESDTKYDGVFSYKAESHSYTWGVGLGLGLVLALRFAPEIAGVIGSSLATLLVYSYSDRRQKAKDAPVPAYVVKQSEQEPHYLTGGVVSGLVVGLGVVAVFAVMA